MATQIQLRQGTTTEHDTFTGAVGEVTVDTTNKTLRVHDGSTAGGTRLATLTGGLVPVSQLPDATTSVKGAVILNNTLTSTSTTQALTAAQGKVLRDQAFWDGVGYYNVTSSRVKGTVYTAIGDKPRTVIIDVESSGSLNDDVFFVRKDSSSSWVAVGQRGSGSRTIYPIVLPNYQYKFESATNFTKWVEVY